MVSRTEAKLLSLERFTRDAKALVVAGQALADERKHAEVVPLHVLAAALARDTGFGEVLRRAGADTAELGAGVERALGALPKGRESAYLSVAMIDLLERAEREAERERQSSVRVDDLVNALSQEIRGSVGELFSSFGIGPGALRPHIGALRSASRSGAEPPTASVSAADALRPLAGEADVASGFPVVGRGAEQRRVLTVLERRSKCHPLLVGEPGVGKRAIVTALVRRFARGDIPTSLVGAPLFELDLGLLLAGARLRAELDERLARLLARLHGSSEPAIVFVRGIEQLFGTGPLAGAAADAFRRPLERAEFRLIGTTTPDGLRRIQERDPDFLRLLTLLDVAEPTPEQAQEIVRGVALRLEAHHHVSIEEAAISAAVELGKRHVHDRFLPDSAIDLLDEAAARKRVEIDGPPEAADAEISRLESIEVELARLRDIRDEAATRVRAKLEQERAELSPRIRAIRDAVEARRGIVHTVRAVRAEIAETRRALEAAQSEKNFARVGELEHSKLPALEAKLAASENEARSSGADVERGVLAAEDVAKTLALWTGIPVQRMLEGEAEKLLKMEERLAERVVGQDPAVGAIARAVRRSRVGLRDPGRPIGSFLFLGPSGVGKTELAKALAQLLFDDEHALTRLDMSEFMERHMAQRLIGAPPGYADSEQGGFLTEAVRRRPYSVLLFDEVEKAHQDVFNLLLQVLDEGRLTDGRGRLADFSNTVVIMTSNLGSDRILDSEPRLFETEEGRDALRDVLLERLREFFRPELLNRIDEVLVFRPLSREHLRRVVDLQLEHVERLLADRELALEVSDAAKARLVELGYEPALGARPVKRTILREVQDPVAEALLSGRFGPGATLCVDVRDGEITLGPKA